MLHTVKRLAVVARAVFILLYRLIMILWNAGPAGRLPVVLGALVGIFLLMVLVVPVPPVTQTAAMAAPITEPTPEPTIAPTPLPLTAIGQDLKVGDVRWKVLSATDEGDTLKADNDERKPKTTAGTWLRVRLEVENQSTDTRHISSESIDVRDGQGRTYKASDAVSGYIPEADYCGYAQVNPNIPRTCQMIYEVPRDAAGLRAVMGDLVPLGATDGEIDLGQ